MYGFSHDYYKRNIRQKTGLFCTKSAFFGGWFFMHCLRRADHVPGRIAGEEALRTRQARFFRFAYAGEYVFSRFSGRAIRQYAD